MDALPQFDLVRPRTVNELAKFPGYLPEIPKFFLMGNGALTFGVTTAQLFCDSRESLRHEAGEFRLAVTEGLISGDEHVRAELGEVLAGTAENFPFENKNNPPAPPAQIVPSCSSASAFTREPVIRFGIR